MLTRFTKHFGLTTPLMNAPMARMSGPDLALAVSQAGGLGTFGGVVAPPFEIPWSYVEDGIAQIRDATDRPFGVGFITHHLECAPGNFHAALDAEVPVILLSFTDPRPWLQQIKAKGLKAICQVQRFEEIGWAVSEGADAVSVQGAEAGGHCGAMNLLPFLVQARTAYPDLPILVSGGVACGRSLAGVLAAGADGAWIGTGFRATSDCKEISAEEQAAILASNGRNTRRQHVNDTITREAFKFVPWPDHIGLRAIDTPLVETWHGREAELAETARTHPEQFLSLYDDPSAANYPHLFGEAAGQISRLESAADFMARLVGDAETHLRATLESVGDR